MNPLLTDDRSSQMCPHVDRFECLIQCVRDICRFIIQEDPVILVVNPHALVLWTPQQSAVKYSEEMNYSFSIQ